MLNLPPELQATLLDRRVVFVRGRLDDASANSAITQLLLLGRTAAGRAVEVYLDSPGGSMPAALSVYDMLQTLDSPVSVTCLGTAGGAAVVVLAGGSLGRRFALPHARVHLADEVVELAGSAAGAHDADLASQAEAAARVRSRWIEVLARHAAHSAERIARDLARGVWLSAAEARDYGLVDGIIPGAPALGGVRPR
ncbi:MAG: ATP-dependent Clp protease proteolytic subunit [Chloroflexota bacterium]|nr:ATP-dependent Clp protease proteolytic subunit [Chloroflexota bacterium]